MKGILYRNKCIACGYCQSLAPELWAISPDDGKAVWIESNENSSEVVFFSISPELYLLVKRSAETCPINAIKVV